MFIKKYNENEKNLTLNPINNSFGTVFRGIKNIANIVCVKSNILKEEIMAFLMGYHAIVITQSDFDFTRLLKDK